MKYNDRVRIKSGFFKGQIGSVVAIDHFLFWKHYIVHMDEAGFEFFFESNLEVIKESNDINKHTNPYQQEES